MDWKTTDSPLSEALRTERKRQSLTQEDLAKRAVISVKTLYRLEHAKEKWPVGTEMTRAFDEYQRNQQIAAGHCRSRIKSNKLEFFRVCSRNFCSFTTNPPFHNVDLCDLVD